VPVGRSLLRTPVTGGENPAYRAYVVDTTERSSGGVVVGESDQEGRSSGNASAEPTCAQPFWILPIGGLVNLASNPQAAAHGPVAGMNPAADPAIRACKVDHVPGGATSNLSHEVDPRPTRCDREEEHPTRRPRAHRESWRRRPEFLRPGWRKRVSFLARHLPSSIPSISPARSPPMPFPHLSSACPHCYA
jgi:hypothetical protein